MKVLGLTGSIATGKSYVSQYLKKNSIEVFDADFAVANLLKESEVISLVEKSKNLASCIINGQIDKKLLSTIVFSENKYLDELEEIIHPLITKNINKLLSNKKTFLILEIPLLFEKKYDIFCDKVITTVASNKAKIKRALNRDNMNREKLNFIMQRQFSDSKKAALSDYVIYTDISYNFTDIQLAQIVKKEGLI